MQGKSEEFSTKYALFLSSLFVHTTQDYLTYYMTNYLKALKNSLNKIIGGIIFGLQWTSH